jgi:hypothetical protein
MKNLLSALLCLVCAIVLAQTSKTNTTPSPKEKLIAQHWKLFGTEEFGVIKKAGAKEANDGAAFESDHKANITLAGTSKTGNWSMDKYGSFLTVAIDSSSEKRSYKISKLVNDTLVLEYKDSALVKTKYHFLRQP